MKIKSVIKTVFDDELLKLIGSVCDTRRIDSNITKMKTVTELLKSRGVVFEIIGGATNRLVINTKGYLIKIAIDNQGYVDNLIEYSLSPELQPYVTKTYETNGYILVAKYVKTITLDEFHMRRADILKVLEILSQDYLLGDVGYIDKNFTNWGVEDDGRVVILDYAYMHRGTENLFTCEVCGDGFLRYDSTYTYLKCTNGTVCHAKFSYIDRKIIQGDQVDLDMIEERKADSITLPKGKFEAILNDDGSIDDGRKVIKTREEYLNYIKEDMKMRLSNLDRCAYQDLIIRKCMATTDEERAEIEKEMARLISDADCRDEDYEEPEIDYDPDEDDYDDDNDCDDCSHVLSLDDIINMTMNGQSVSCYTPSNPKPVETDEPFNTNDYYDQSEENDCSDDDESNDSQSKCLSLDDIIDMANNNQFKPDNKSEHGSDNNTGKYHKNRNRGYKTLDDLINMGQQSNTFQKSSVTTDYYDKYDVDSMKKTPLDAQEQEILDNHTVSHVDDNEPDTETESTDNPVEENSNEPIQVNTELLQQSMMSGANQPSITINGKPINEYYQHEGSDA